MSSSPRFHVAKVGGSLLRRTRLPQRLIEWLEKQPAENRWLIMVGGGQRVETIRARQTRLGWTDEECHWKAIAAMEANTRELNDRLGIPLPFVESTAAFVRSGFGRAFLLPVRWASGLDEVPTNWSVTSDTLAALLAAELGGQAGQPGRLTLFKSIELSKLSANRKDWGQIARLGGVDPEFPAHAAPLKSIDWHCLPE